MFLFEKQFFLIGVRQTENSQPFILIIDNIKYQPLLLSVFLKFGFKTIYNMITEAPILLINFFQNETQQNKKPP